MMPEYIHKILESALQAPSGENSQPWKFRVVGTTIEHYHNPQSDTSIYNYKNRGSFVAHGAAIENMCIAAAALGYKATVSLFPASDNPDYIARITITPSPSSDQSAKKLYSTIALRTSNRKPYTQVPLRPEHAEELLLVAQSYEQLGIKYQRIIEREKIVQLANVGATNEEIMLQNKLLHEFFFNHLTWTKEEDTQKKVGFFIQTLELPFPVQILFKLIRHWWAMAFLIKVGFPKAVRASNAITDAAAAEFGVLTTENNTPEDYIHTGRLLERLWLTASLNGLQVQILTGTIYLYYAQEGDRNVFSQQERSLLDTQISILRSMLYKERATVTCMFRIGYGPTATSRAARYTVEECLLE